MNMEIASGEVVIPLEDVVEFKNARRSSYRRRCPRYLLTRMTSMTTPGLLSQHPGVTGSSVQATSLRRCPAKMSESFLTKKERATRPDARVSPASNTHGEPCGSKKARSPTSRARSSRSTKTSSSSRCWSTSSAGKPLSSCSSPKSARSRAEVEVALLALQLDRGCRPPDVQAQFFVGLF
ncbi:UNVERIFIED_CONTAM: hypothetical protein GTU68_026384 [Idotea baltica]|nr:hypothetical protein [Idotea baltica]